MLKCFIQVTVFSERYLHMYYLLLIVKWCFKWRTHMIQVMSDLKWQKRWTARNVREHQQTEMTGAMNVSTVVSNDKQPDNTQLQQTNWTLSFPKTTPREVFHSCASITYDISIILTTSCGFKCRQGTIPLHAQCEPETIETFCEIWKWPQWV